MPHKRASWHGASKGALCLKAQEAIAHAVSNGARPPTWARAAKLHLELPSRPRTLVTVPAEHVLHVPAWDGGGATDDDEDLALCPAYEAALHDPAAVPKCPRGTACRHVHALLHAATLYSPHILADAQHGAYPRVTSRAVVAIRAQRHRTRGIEAIPADRVLVTRALDETRATLAHCLHFVSKGRCDRGSECRFVHAVPATATATEPSRRSGATLVTSADVSARDGPTGPVRPRHMSPSEPPSTLAGLASWQPTAMHAPAATSPRTYPATPIAVAFDIVCAHAEFRRQPVACGGGNISSQRRVHRPYSAAPSIPASSPQ